MASEATESDTANRALQALSVVVKEGGNEAINRVVELEAELLVVKKQRDALQDDVLYHAENEWMFRWVRTDPDVNFYLQRGSITNDELSGGSGLQLELEDAMVAESSLREDVGQLPFPSIEDNAHSDVGALYDAIYCYWGDHVTVVD